MTILEEAQAVTADRREKYGSARDHWGLTVRLVNAWRGTDFTAADWGIIMTFDKIARDAWTHQRDNAVDAAGYLSEREKILEEDNLFR